MFLKVRRSIPDGNVLIPGSKSHTIRALFFAALADGTSVIRDPLVSDDADSAINVLERYGAHITAEDDRYIVKGFGNIPCKPIGEIDAGNSGTTLNFAASMAALAHHSSILTGDHQIKRRPVGPLLEALNVLGAKASSLKNNGCPPISVQGKLHGGHVQIPCVTSQYLSSLLITLPLAEKDSTIIPTILNERPYADMTLWWLDMLDIGYERQGYSLFHIPGGQKYLNFDFTVPGDYSSATFFIVLAAITGGRIRLLNLMTDDPQGDKQVLDIVSEMGAKVQIDKDCIIVEGSDLRGADIDMNAVPDALPAFAVMGCFAKGRTRLRNVSQARLKETDRIRVMYGELKKMGADIKELDDGLEIQKSDLKGTRLNGHGDHRVVMALSLAGAMCNEQTVIDTAEAVRITFPGYVELMRKIGMDMEITGDG
jgi:3-phosphoshikimate 1-carboxyvinyltransferase